MAIEANMSAPSLKSILHLIYSARRKPEAMEVLHDALSERYAVYPKLVQDAHRLSRVEGRPVLVVVDPKKLIKADRQWTLGKERGRRRDWIMEEAFRTVSGSELTWIRGQPPRSVRQRRLWSYDEDEKWMLQHVNRFAFVNISGWQRAVVTYVPK